MAVNVQRISLTHEKLHCLYRSEGGVFYHLINAFGPFFSHFATLTFCKVEFAYVSSARETARKSQKYFDLSSFN